MPAPHYVHVRKAQNAWREYADTGSAIEQHSGVSMFHSFPRLGKSSRLLAASWRYYTGIIYAVGIPLGIGFFICGICVLATICRFTCLAKNVERRIEIRNSRNELKNKRYLMISTVVLNTSLISLSVSSLGVAALSDTLLNISGLSEGLLKYLKNEGLSAVDLIEFLRTKFISFDSRTLENEFFAVAFEALQTYIPPLFPDLSPLRSNAASFFDRSILITRDLVAVVSVLSAALVAIFALMIFAYVAVYLSEVTSRRRYGCRFCFSLIFILVPLLLSWLMFAVWSGVAIVLADTCDMLHEYRAILLFTNSSTSDENLLVKTGLHCAALNSSRNLQDRTSAAVEGFIQNPESNTTLAQAFGIASADFYDALRWIEGGVNNLINCSMLVQSTGKYEQLACGGAASSAFSSVLYLWFGQMLFSVTLTLLFVLLIGGCYSTWSMRVWNPALEEESEK